ncbi:alanine racemase [Allorhizocola rhizosphaerae]|uniref:alanine racemase n=1 Tax=Allorhizocola rhizosphaerae TaxID=1872709 RepID=UPI001FE2B244|nr:alanine racemase [Allorhizocola rhizosphaerae]
MLKIDWRAKGFWLPDGDGDDAAVIGRHLFDGPFSWPVMVAKRPAIEHNLATMAAYCARHGVELAPHGKTTMAPTLIDAQLKSGAWGITAATPNQALIMRKLGVPRVLLANELLDVRVLRWAASLDWEFYSYVDSLAGVAALKSAGVPARVFVEIGFPGGRTGCRTVHEAVAVARAASSLPGVEVVGVSGFEGLLSDLDGVAEYLDTMADAARAIGGPIVSAGGSAFFDLVVERLTGVAERLVLRSGCYITHDHGLYADSSPFHRVPDEGTLLAALEVWAQVLSAPERGVVIAGAGRRDVPHDSGLPVPLRVRGLDGVTREADGPAFVERLSDQHAHLRGLSAVPGELVCFGISHPCTAFDKWRAIPVVDDGYRVLDVIETYF